jgi:protein-tyrosine phosphatase
LTDSASLQGASNFRDLGGYARLDGRRVRRGHVFRSDHLADLTAADLAKLQALSLSHSIDFRGLAENDERPYRIAGVTRLGLAIEPTVVRRLRERMTAGQVPSIDETVAMMCETYHDFVHEHGATFGCFLRHLLTHRTPVVFHCTAGKDRTGFAAALLLSTLGIDRDTIMQDYLLTNQLYRRSRTLEGGGPAHVMEVIWQVQPSFLQAAFDAIDQDFGGLSAYLAGPVGIEAGEVEQLRQLLLVP